MVAKTIEVGHNPIVVYFLGDIHEGAANMQREALLRAVKRIESDGDYWIGVGDYIDAINHHDPRFNPREIADTYSIKDLAALPVAQTDRLAAMLMPIAGKCLGLIAGNHEDSLRKHNTYDATEMLCKLLSCDNLGHKAWLSLLFRKHTNVQSIKIVACHGAGGGGMREGYPLNKVFDTLRNDIADVHVMGHLHQMTTKRAVMTTYEYGAIRKIPTWYGTNGCFLTKSEEGTEGYFEQRPGHESDIGMLRLSVSPLMKDKSGTIVLLDKVYI